MAKKLKHKAEEIKTLKIVHIKKKKKKNLKKMTTVMRLPNNESFLNHKFCTVYSQTFTACCTEMSDRTALGTQS